MLKHKVTLLEELHNKSKKPKMMLRMCRKNKKVKLCNEYLSGSRRQVWMVRMKKSSQLIDDTNVNTNFTVLQVKRGNY